MQKTSPAFISLPTLVASLLVLLVAAFFLWPLVFSTAQGTPSDSVAPRGQTMESLR